MLEKLWSFRQRPRKEENPAPADNIIWLRPAFSSETRLSFASVANEGEFRAWHESVVQALGRDDASYVCEPKVEGVGVTLTYRDGALAEAATRGGGPESAAVSRHLRAIPGVPKSIARGDAPRRMEVLGDVYLPRGLSQTSTARGAVSLETGPASESPFRVIVHGIASSEGGSVPDNHRAALAYLKDMGFDISPHSRLARTPAEVTACYREWLEKRDDLGYDCGGVVVKVNRLDYQRRMGYASYQARWGVVYRFPAPAPGAGLREPLAGATEVRPSPLAGLRLAVAGEPGELSRPQIEQMLGELGGAVSERLDQSVDFLILGYGAPETEIARARQHRVRIVPLQEFLRYYHAIRLSGRLSRLVDRLERLQA